MAFGYEEELRAEIARLRDAIDEQTGRAAWHYECLTQCEEKVIQRDAEIERLRLAIRRLAEQDATLSVQGGNVTVDMDGTLTPEERAVLVQCVKDYEDSAATFYERLMHEAAAKGMKQAVVIRGLLERLGGG